MLCSVRYANDADDEVDSQSRSMLRLYTQHRLHHTTTTPDMSLQVAITCRRRTFAILANDEDTECERQ